MLTTCLNNLSVQCKTIQQQGVYIFMSQTKTCNSVNELTDYVRIIFPVRKHLRSSPLRDDTQRRLVAIY
jgi:hypothetical protein